ncbi:hypothetical protein KDL01_15600 [Actinospica durhamensis]|uniref:histidine kinase n=1 Tax=Actinospica durhamensis TaxID=1508375 RepID=A0A941ETA4_9ACTN|nr:histidine kinase [Actinospica durhamensis]MBR7834699.1 hypothetical protein [Actinospica durhamensis]
MTTDPPPPLGGDPLERAWNSPPAVRLAAFLGRVGRLDRRRPYVADALVALLVLSLGVAALAGLGDAEHPHMIGHVPTAVALIPLAGQALPLTLRRMAPFPVACAVLAACTAQWAMGYSMPSTIGLLLALYAVARYARLERLLWIAPATSAGMIVPAFTLEPFLEQAWTSLFLLWCTATAACALGLVARVRQDRLTALAERAARLELERETRAQLATLTERARVSREMHDIVGHNLAVMIGLADSAAYAGDPVRNTEMLGLIADTGRQALVELRRTLGAMRAHPVGPRSAEPEPADLSPQPGIADLPALLERVRAAGPTVTYRSTGEVESVSAGIQLAAYRIVQEALTNAFKHAGAQTAVLVALSVTEDELVLEVCDEGRREQVGVAARVGGGAAEPAPGLGLAGIRERAQLTGGHAEAGPAPSGRGWLVHAYLPLGARPDRRD